jgi:tetratricopeptide (TPR) repeat protein
MNETRNLLYRSDTSRAIDVVERFEGEHPGHWRAALSRLYLEIHRGDSDRIHEAAAALSSSASAPVGTRATGVAGGSYADRAAGRWRETRDHMKDAARFAEMNGAPATALAWSLAEAENLLFLVADTTQAQRKLREILAGGAFDALEPPQRPWARVTGDLIQCGLIEEAQEYFDRWEAELSEADRGPGYPLDRRVAQAFLDLATSGDLDEAIPAIQELRIQARCVRCWRLSEAELEARRGRVAEAIGLYELAVNEPNNILRYPAERALALERLGPLYEEAGESDKAIDAYTRFAEAWEDADPELQPRVDAAREAVARLRAGASGG